MGNENDEAALTTRLRQGPKAAVFSVWLERPTDRVSSSVHRLIIIAAERDAEDDRNQQQR